MVNNTESPMGTAPRKSTVLKEMDYTCQSLKVNNQPVKTVVQLLFCGCCRGDDVRFLYAVTQ